MQKCTYSRVHFCTLFTLFTSSIPIKTCHWFLHDKCIGREIQFFFIIQHWKWWISPQFHYPMWFPMLNQYSCSIHNLNFNLSKMSLGKSLFTPLTSWHIYHCHILRKNNTHLHIILEFWYLEGNPVFAGIVFIMRMLKQELGDTHEHIEQNRCALIGMGTFFPFFLFLLMRSR